MNEKLVNEALKLLCKKYKADNGSSISNLARHKFSYDVFVDLDEKSKLSRKIQEDINLMGRIVDELDTQGNVVNKYDQFHLTEKGFKVGTENFLQKSIRYLNTNPGFAIVISFISLLVSLVALFVSSTKT